MTLRYTRTVVTLACGLAALVMGSRPAATPAFTDWTAAMNIGAAINTPFIDAGPALSKDGLTLYFNSNRPGGFGENDIWVARRASLGSPWGTPQNLGPVVNSEAVEGVPALSRDEHWLFFNSTRVGGFGNQDLWVSYRAHTHDDFAWETPVNLGSQINTAGFDAGAAFLEGDEPGPTTIFFGSTRPGGFGSFDIYMSEVLDDGWIDAARPVTELNTGASDQRPSIRFDGLEIFLQSDRPGSIGGADLWVSTREDLSWPWTSPVNLGALVNSPATDQQPHIAADRETLFFASNRPGGVGGLDIYVVSRTQVRPH